MDQKYKWIIVFICILIVKGVVKHIKSETNTPETQNENITEIQKDTTHWGNGKVDSISEDQFITLVADFNTDKEKYIGEGPAFVDIFTTWCGPCRQLAPTIEALAESCAGTIQFYKLDLDENRNLAEAYGIHYIPYILYCDSSKIQHISPQEMMIIIQKIQSQKNNSNY